MLLFWLRVVCLVLWAAAALILAPSTCRYLKGGFEACDEYRTAFFFTALLFIGSLGRWLVAPEDQQIFTALSALTGALAVYVILLSWQRRQR